MQKIWSALDGFHKKHPLLILLFVSMPVLLWFSYLNYINWYDGSISNGLHGLKFWLDSERYISGAESIAGNMPLQGRELQFTCYMFLIAVVKWLHLPLTAMAILQIVIALAAAIALVDAGRLISGSRIPGWFAAALFLCNPFIARWHIYIMTESLYTSAIILCLWSLLRMLIFKKAKDYVLSLLILIFTIFMRPNGWILLPIFAVFYLFSVGIKPWILFTTAVSMFAIFVAMMGVLPVFKNSIQITTPIENLQKGITVWGHEELNLTMPQEPDIDASEWTSGIKYIALHPLASAKLALVRAGYSLIHIRPYHSNNYKMLVILWVFPAYLLAFLGLLKYRRKPIIIAGLFFILGHLLVVALSYAEHDSRFDIYPLPVFYFFAGLGFYYVFRKIPFSVLYGKFNHEK